MSEDPITRLNAALQGRYRIERELGEGGMATVYLADDLKHERKVALKVLKPELASGALKSLPHENEELLLHPKVVEDISLGSFLVLFMGEQNCGDGLLTTGPSQPLDLGPFGSQPPHGKRITLWLAPHQLKRAPLWLLAVQRARFRPKVEPDVGGVRIKEFLVHHTVSSLRQPGRHVPRGIDGKQM